MRARDFCLIVILISSIASQARADAAFFFSRDPSTAVIRWTSGGIGSQYSTTIYGDGSVVAVIPPGFKRVGTWHGQLAPERLDALLRQLKVLGVFEFDKEAVERKLADREKSGCSDLFTSNEGQQELEILLDELLIDGESLAPFSKTVRWSSIDFEIERCPRVEELRRLARAFRLLFEIEELTQMELQAQ